MEVRFHPDLQARLTQRATQQGREPDEFVQDVVARYLEEEDRFIEAVKRGEDALKSGNYLSQEQAGERLHRFYSPQLPLTEPQRAELERRLEMFEHNRDNGVTWAALKVELAQRCP